MRSGLFILGGIILSVAAVIANLVFYISLFWLAMTVLGNLITDDELASNFLSVAGAASAGAVWALVAAAVSLLVGGLCIFLGSRGE